MNNIRVAVVDDNPVYLYALVSLLKQNHELDVVIATDNFKDFLDELSVEEPDLILIDDSVLNGLRENIRKGFMKYLRETPMIIMGLEFEKEIDSDNYLDSNIRYLKKEAKPDKILRQIIQSIICHNLYKKIKQD